MTASSCISNVRLPTRLHFSVLALMLAAIAASAPAAAHAQGQDHCGAVSNNQTWTRASNPHNVTCDVVVRNSTLELEPGVQILMAAGTNLIIESGGSLQAVGNQNGRIRIRAVADGAPAGTWGQVRFLSGAAQSALEFTDISDGGKDDEPMVLIEDSVVVLGTQPPPASSVKNVRLFNAKAVPLAITANDVGPSLTGAGDFSLGAACDHLSIEASNGTRAIEVLAAGEPDVLDSQIWFDFCVPYLAQDVITVGGPDDPTLQLNAGVEVRFGPDGGIEGGLDADNPGQFETNGTPSEPILLTGIEANPGAWGGIDLTDFTLGGHSLSGTRVEHGGHGGRPMVRVTTDNAIAGEIELTGAEGLPLEISAAGVQPFLEYAWLAETPIIVDNGVQAVRVLADGEGADIRRATTWGDPGAPYQIVGDLTVAREADAARFRLAPGATLLFAPGKGLILGDPQLGTAQLYVDGEPGRPVTLRGLDQTSGSWAGVDVTDDAEVVDIRGAAIADGGSADRAMVRWASASGAMTTTTLSGAPGYPMSLPFTQLAVIAGETVGDPALVNHLEGNGVDRFLVGGVDLADSGRMGWHNPGAPIEFDGDVVLTGIAMRLDLYDGVALRFRPGHRMRLGADSGHHVTLHLVDDDPTTRVEIGAAEPITGWLGLQVRDGSEVDGGGADLTGAAAGAASLDLDGGAADLRDVTFQGAKGDGIYVHGSTARFALLHGHIVDNTVGLRAGDGGFASVQESTVQGNTEWGVLNEHHEFCIDAIRVFWGRPGGPSDDSDAADKCMNATNLSPGADKVSDFVDWWPYALDGGTYPPAPGLGPNPKRIFIPTILKAVRTP